MKPRLVLLNQEPGTLSFDGATGFQLRVTVVAEQ